MPWQSTAEDCLPRGAGTRSFALIKAYLCRDSLPHLTSSAPHAGAGGARTQAISDRIFPEHLPRHCDLGHLEGDVAALADDLGTDLDQLLA
jgi:hypothetical protein